MPKTTVEIIQIYFHAVINGRAQDLVNKHSLRLPEISVLLELSPNAKMWFTVPGMAGGFNYWFESEGYAAKFVSESWCRVVQGSGERHEIDHRGLQLVASGFV